MRTTMMRVTVATRQRGGRTFLLRWQEEATSEYVPKKGPRAGERLRLGSWAVVRMLEEGEEVTLAPWERTLEGHVGRAVRQNVRRAMRDVADLADQKFFSEKGSGWQRPGGFIPPVLQFAEMTLPRRLRPKHLAVKSDQAGREVARRLRRRRRPAVVGGTLSETAVTYSEPMRNMAREFLRRDAQALATS